MKKKYIALIIILFLALIILVYIAYNASSKPDCDQSLWENVYHPNRLKIISNCTSVTGTIRAVFREKDGDYHIRLEVDDKYRNLLNPKNIEEQHGDLVVETICQNPVTQKSAIESCKNFSKFISAPKVGKHVAVTGSYVLDAEHGWMEIHPATSIKVRWFDIFS